MFYSTDYKGGSYETNDWQFIHVYHAKKKGFVEHKAFTMVSCYHGDFGVIVMVQW